MPKQNITKTQGPVPFQQGMFSSGSGAPTFSAPKGAVYSRTDGSSASTRLYINTDGATAWTSVTTAT